MTWPGASPRPSASRPSCATASRTCKGHRHARGRPQGSGRRAETVRIFHFPHQSAAARAGRGQSPGPGRPGQPGKADRRPAGDAGQAPRRAGRPAAHPVHQRPVALDGAAVRRRSAIAGPQSGLPGLRVPGPRPGGAGAARRHRPAGRVAGKADARRAEIEKWWPRPPSRRPPWSASRKSAPRCWPSWKGRSPPSAPRPTSWAGTTSACRA